MASVLVLHARLAEPGPPEFESLLGRLPYAKQLELGRRDIRDRAASLAGIALVLAGATRLRGHAVGAERLRFPAEGRPTLDGGPWFSVSHGGQRVAAALCNEVEVGFDLEEAGPARQAPVAAKMTLDRWTATEAVLKAAGRSLRELRQVRLDDALETGTLGGRVYRLAPVALSAGVVAHLATPVAVVSLTVEELALSV